MNENQGSVGGHSSEDWASAPAPAGADALPSLKSDNCIKGNANRSLFVAQGNIYWYIRKFGENNVAILTPTVSDCLSAFEFQKMWHSWLTNHLKKIFPTGMYTRERQPRSGNWHAHAVVNVGFDIKTGFPFDQVEKRFYANVDSRIREIWKELREAGAKYGFGRIELLPIKYGGAACANYVTKYIAKRQSSEKSEGEEKCRLFGIWGKVRFVSSRFSWARSRIVRKRKAWLAAQFPEMGIVDDDGFKKMLGNHWWFHVGAELMDVILPVKYYQIPKDGGLAFDDIGFRAYCDDLLKYKGVGDMDAMVTESRFRLFYAMGKLMFGRQGEQQALDFALNRIGRSPEPVRLPELKQTKMQL